MRKVVLLDNNVLRFFFDSERESQFDDWLHFLRSKFWGAKSITFVPTPFQFLESIGLGNQIPTPPIESWMNELIDIDRANLPEFRERVVRYAFDFFSNHESLRAITLRDKYKEQISHFSHGGAAFYKTIFENIVEKNNFEREIYRNLAFDFLYKLNMNEKALDLPLSALVDVYRGLNDGLNITQFRAVKSLWLKMYPILKEEASNQEELQRVHEALMLENQSDYLDTEVIHYAAVGWMDKTLIPVNVFTMDPADEIELRVSAFITMLRYAATLAQKMRKQESLPFETFSLKKGVLWFFSSKGEFILKKKVKRISSVQV